MYAPIPVSGNPAMPVPALSGTSLHKTPCRALLDAVPAGILQIGPDESIRFANARFAAMLGYTPDDFPASLCELIHPDTHFHSRHTWKDLWHTMREFEVPIRFRCKNGHYIATDNLVRLMLDENGQPDFALLVSRPALADNQPVSRLHLSLSDPLTSLPTRNYLDYFLPDALARSHKNGKMLALLELNINRFRIVNESLGYDAGDALLREIARRLVHAVHENDSVIRAGGDEFIVVLENIGTPADTAAIASRLMQTVTEPMTLAGHSYSVTVSIGASLYPRDAAESRTLLRYADIALAEARKKPTGNIRFFHPGMHVEPSVKLKLESELRRALEKNEFVLFYQPRLSLKTGEVTSLEALIRWRHPEKGLLSPDTFIPFAEEIGLIGKIGHIVRHNLTRQLMQWRDRPGMPLPVAFNVSTCELCTGHLAASLKDILRETGLPPGMLEVEITESRLIENMHAVRANLASIRKLGIAISIDDFGTGYSSLRYLSSLPIDLLKIDGTFIDGLIESDAMQSIVKSTIGMAHSLNMAVIAEGVSTPDQLDILKSWECDQIQGYLCSPPLPSGELETFLRNRRPGMP